MVFTLLLFGLILQTGTQQQTPAQQPERNSLALKLEESIKGKENLPAEEVWKNIKIFNGRPAIQVLRIMELAYTPGLGVKCSYCHNTEKWESDEKKPKEIARQMSLMLRELNPKLQTITGKDDATVNCTTCHRGDTKPALNLSPRQRTGG